MARERTRSQVRERVQIRGRLRTTQMREGHDDLDIDRGIQLPVGTSFEAVEYGGDDEWDADLQIDDCESDDSVEAGEESAPLADLAEDPDQQAERGSQFDPSDIFGSSIPAVHVRLHVEGNLLRAVPVGKPSPEGSNELEAIQELTSLVAHAFRPEQQRIWEPLVREQPVGPIERLLILARLALRPGDPVPLPNGGTFCPDDRELARFRRKFAMFPDGTPFCIALVLRDERGRRKAGNKPSAPPSGLAGLPDSVVLIGLQNALDAERAEGIAQEDSDFGKRLRKEFEALGVSLGIITDNEVRRLRDDLKRRRKRLGNQCRVQFLNRKERQQEYEHARSAERGESTQ